MSLTRSRTQTPPKPMKRSTHGFVSRSLTPSPTDICIFDGFKPGSIYELIYPAKDPTVMGLGLVVTRDLGSFLRYQPNDGAGHANPLAALLFAVDARLVGFFIRRSFSFFLFASLCFLSFERCLYNGLVVFGCRVIRLHCKHFVVSFDRFLVGMVLCLGIAEGVAAGWGLYFPETFSGSEKIKRTVGRDAPPHRVVEKLLRCGVVAAIEGDSSLLVGREPQISEPRCVRRRSWCWEL